MRSKSKSKIGLLSAQMEVRILIANRNRFCGIFESSVTQCVYAYMIVCTSVCVCVGVCVCVHLLLCYCMHNIAYTRFVRLLIDWVKASDVLERQRERQEKRDVREGERGCFYTLTGFVLKTFRLFCNLHWRASSTRSCPLCPIGGTSLLPLCSSFAFALPF